MKVGRHITRRRAKWAGLVASLLLFVLSLTSIFWFSLHHASRGTNSVSGISLHWGRVLVWRRIGATARSAYAPTKIYRVRDPGFEFWPFLLDTSHIELGGGTGRFQRLSVPLWLPMLFIAVPTVYLWRRDRRPQPWQCRACRYDLRGIDGGVCPECGSAIGVV